MFYDLTDINAMRFDLESQFSLCHVQIPDGNIVPLDSYMLLMFVPYCLNDVYEFKSNLSITVVNLNI